MEKQKSARNKTIDLPLEECREYFERCLSVEKGISHTELDDSVICGDFFETSRFLPDKSFALIIADPPYNLRKNYGGEVFSKMDDDEYAEQDDDEESQPEDRIPVAHLLNSRYGGVFYAVGGRVVADKLGERVRDGHVARLAALAVQLNVGRRLEPQLAC